MSQAIEEPVVYSHFEDTPPRSQFIYVSTGINPLPTVALGYRKLYGSFGSDLSLSTSIFPLPPFLGSEKWAFIPFPGINYKQLFFMGKGWKDTPDGNSAFYVGLETGVYPLAKTVNGGGVLGWQFRREKRWDFFEIGIHPFLYAGNSFSINPLGSLTYAFLF